MPAIAPYGYRGHSNFNHTRMQKSILITLLCFFISGAMHAQKVAAAKVAAVKTSETPQQKVKDLMAKMTTACSLKPEQVTKLANSYTEYYTKHDALKKQKDILDKGAYDDRSSAMKKTRDAVLKATLTANQYKQWMAVKSKEKKDAKKDKGEE